MSSIKDIQYAMNGEQNVNNSIEPEYVPQSVMKNNKTSVSREFVLFKLIKNNRGGLHMPAIDYVIDPRTITKDNPNGNGPEMIRVIEGVNTIWAKEQKDIAPELIKRKIRTIEFKNGSRFLRVPAWDVALLEFMRVCRHNIKSEGRTQGSKFEFFEYDPNEVAKARLDRELLEINAVTKANTQELSKMEKHAFYLGILLVNELGLKKKEDALRVDYMIAAKRDPKRFMESFDSEEVDVRYMVMNAIVDGKIDLGRDNFKAFYANGGGLICSIPASEQAIDTLTNFALQKNKEGKDFLEQLKIIAT